MAVPTEKSPQELAGLVYEPIDNIPKINQDLRKAFLTNKTLPIEYRKNQLKQFSFMISDNRDALVKAINADLGRSTWETIFVEINGVLNEVVEAIHNIDKWAKTEKPWPGMAWAMHGAQIRKEPKGTVLILGAWNYPMAVQLGPLIGAISAGCTVVLKPSEVAPNTAKLYGELFPKYFDPETIRCVQGAVPETTALLNERWEHIFYTGNGTVGRIVAEKAAKWLCPTTLELGGKSPVIIDDTADVKLAARRILWGKEVNCGQTCIAPDYVIVTESVQDKLVAEFQKAAKEFFPNGNAKSPDYGRIINVNHWKRLNNLVQTTKGRVVVGGQGDEAQKYLDVTVVADVKPDDPIMAGEIFGPILPIMPVKNLDAALEFVNARDQPLALYVFGGKSTVERVLDQTRSGGVVAGDTLLHYAVGPLPFGGTGPSGYGAYHGKYNFLTFSHERATMVAPQAGILGNVIEAVTGRRYPPYKESNLKFFNLLMAKSNNFARPKNPHARVTKAVGGRSKLSVLLFVIATLVALRRATAVH